MNETLKHIEERFSCRQYLPQMPEAAQIEAIAKAAVQAPSSINRQRWQVIVLRDAALIEELDAEGMRALAALPDKSMFERIQSRGGKLFYGVPCVIFVAIEPSDLTGAALDCGIVCQNITLAAQAQGLGSCICGLAGLAFAGEKAASFKERLHFPAGYEFGMAVLIGKPASGGTPHEPDMGKITYIG